MVKQLAGSIGTEQFTVQLGDRGRMVLPASVRHQLGLEEGDQLVLTVAEDSTIQLTSRAHLSGKFRGLYKHLASKRSLVDELIAQRRKEAKRER